MQGEFLGFKCNITPQEGSYTRVSCDRYSQPREKQAEYLSDFVRAVNKKYDFSCYQDDIELFLKPSRDKFTLAAKKLEKDKAALQAELFAAKKEYEIAISSFLQDYQKKQEEITTAYKDKLSVEETLVKTCPHKELLVTSTYYEGEFVSSPGSTEYREYCLFCKKKINEYSR